MHSFQTPAWTALCLAIWLASWFSLSACSKDNEPLGQATTAPTDPMQVSIAQEQLAHYRTAPVELAMVATTQTHPGRIEVNERQISRIGAGVTGRITTVNVELGDFVKPGQLLAQISSPELTASQLAFLRANASLSLAERGVERARQMIQADVISSAEFQKRESEWAIAKAERRAAEDQLKLMGLSAESIEQLKEQGRIQPEGGVHARQAGVVVERKVSAGQVVQPGDPLFTVADLSSVWAVASLPEQSARTVKKNQMVAIEIPALEKTFKGRIVFVSDTVQPETRTVAIRTQLDNPAREIKPQMLVNMRIEGQTKQTPVIPESAVVREHDKDHVFVQVEGHTSNTYRLTPVELEPATGQVRPVRKGLDAGAVVVVEGGFHLNNDRVQKMLTGPNRGTGQAGAH